MKLSAPTRLTWIVALALGLLGLLQRFGVIHVSAVRLDAFWLVAIAFALLVAGTTFKRL